MFKHVITLSDPNQIYSMASEYFREPQEITSQTIEIPGLYIEPLAYNNCDPSNLPYGHIFEDLSQFPDPCNHDQLMFRCNITTAIRGKQEGWRCSGLEVLRDEGIKLYFAHDRDDRVSISSTLARAIVGLRLDNFDHVRLLVWQPSAPLNRQLMGCKDARLVSRLAGAQVGLPERVHHAVIDYWAPELSEAFQATQPPEDQGLRARVTTFINGEPQKMLEFPNTYGGSAIAFATEF